MMASHDPPPDPDEIVWGCLTLVGLAWFAAFMFTYAFFR